MLIIDNDENILNIKELLKKREDSLLKNEEEIKSFLLLNNITQYHIGYDLSVTIWQDTVIKTKMDFLPINFKETHCNLSISFFKINFHNLVISIYYINIYYHK